MNSARTLKRAQRGQSIIVALLVLLLLGIAGALFTTIIARNVLNANRSSRVVVADQYSRAGITFADTQLSTSLEGADWRPPLQYQLGAGYAPAETRELARYNVAVAALPAVNPDDPDLEYLQAGYARYNTGAGRFLLRVTYAPVLLKDASAQLYDPVTNQNITVPSGKYLKIESIGREGVIDPIDPTTYVNNRSTDRTQSYQVAYKPIGITDYARFETNPDKRSDIANLGVVSRYYSGSEDPSLIATPGAYDFTTVTGGSPLNLYPVVTTYGAPDAYLQSSTGSSSIYPNPMAGTNGTAPAGYTTLPGGGSLRANMPARFFGKNLVYLNNANTAPLYQDTVEIAGNLLLSDYDPNTPLNNSGRVAAPAIGQQAALILNPPATGAAPLTSYVSPSNSANGFSTFGGVIRDGSTQNDSLGQPRGIARLDPPLMDAQDTATRLPRYRALSMLSPLRPNLKNADGTAYTPPTTSDTTASKYGYGRSIYVDNVDDTQSDSATVGGGTVLTNEWLHRTAPGNGNTKGSWNGPFYSPPGVTVVLGQRLGTDQAGKPIFGLRLVRDEGSWKNPDGTPGDSATLDVPYSDLDADTTGVNADNDIILYSEGNLRVSGILSPNEGTPASPKFAPRHITLVSNGTAYIEGSLLKGTPDSTIAVLAHNYVCVNTTQFLAGRNLSAVNAPSGSTSLPITLDQPLTQQFGFTQPVGALALYISGGPAANGQTQADFDFLDSAGLSILTPAQQNALKLTFTGPTHTTFDLAGLFSSATADNLFMLQITRDPGVEALPKDPNPIPLQDFLLNRVAVLPMDIRIEAVLYAQTRSFFVIPGDWFNENGVDNLNEYVNSVIRPDIGRADPADRATIQSLRRFPFYGQPIDMKIVIDGAVSEARPADIAAQTEWMLKWGWIPKYHGSTINPTENAGHLNASDPAQPAIGLQMIYNPQAGYPYSLPANANSAGYYLRSDQFGRPLPFAPRLPVSTGLLYSGESGEPPLLQ